MSAQRSATGSVVHGATAPARRPDTRSRFSLRQSDLSTLLLIGDLIAAAAGEAIGIGLWVFFDRSFTPTAGLPAWTLAFVLLWPVLLRLFGGGDVASSRFEGQWLAALAQASIGVTGLVLVLFYLSPFFAPRGTTFASVAATVTTILLWRIGYGRLVGSGLFERRVAIFGLDDAAQRTGRALAEARSTLPHRVVAYLSHTGGVPEVDGVPVLAVSADELWPALRSVAADVLIIGRTGTVPPQMLASLASCFEHGIEALPARTVYEELTGRVMVAQLEADWYAELPTHVRSFYGSMKRAFEVLLIIVTAPVTLTLGALTAVAILVDSGAPVLFTQVRIGQRGRPFPLHKFRSMRPDAEPHGLPVWATAGDPRITRVGRLIRRMRLDELPQLWDVFRGRMSLIGPRPERPEFVAKLASELPLYHARALVRPGLTGWAQVRYSYAGSIEANLAKLEYDLYYVRHVGALLDLGIALRTIAVVLGLKGR